KHYVASGSSCKSLIRLPKTSSSKLIADREFSDALSGRREDGIAQSGRKRRHARLANAARWHIDAMRDDMHPRIERRLIDAHELEVVEVRLLDRTILERDGPVLRKCQPHDRRTFHLRTYP